MRKGFTRKIEPIRVLSDLQIEELHKATLEILETTGVKYESKRALKLFEESGCNVDYESRIVKFPGYLVEECIRTAPSSFRVKGRFPEDDMRIGGNTLYFMPAAGAKLHDEKTGEICGIKPAPGLKFADQFPEPIFTPTTKADNGHDENITFKEMTGILGEEDAVKIRELSIVLFNKVSEVRSRDCRHCLFT